MHDSEAQFVTAFEALEAILAEPWPAWTAIGVSELIVPGGLVELRAVAAGRG